MNTVSKLILILLIGCSEKKPNVQEAKFSLDGGSYPVTINVIITSDIVKAAQYIRDNLDESVETSDFQGVAGITFDFQDGKPGIIWLESATFDPESISIINHELLHATINTMRYSGILPSDSSEEAYTYQLQHYSKQFYSKIK
jgi:hypothetical protein